jgi:prepilin-type N-terminal cleavage/methylation domain-containing protein
MKSEIRSGRRYSRRCFSESGLTLVELLVVLAIIAALAGIIYPAIINSIQKSQAVMAAQRIDAIEKAKVQYRLDHEDNTAATVGLNELKGYLVRFGQSVTKQEDLDQGTGGSIVSGNLQTCAYYTPKDTSAGFANILKQYHVPTASQPEADPATADSTSSTTQ